MAEITDTLFYGWNAFSFIHDSIELIAVPEPGGRIISLKFHGMELLFLQNEHAGESFTLSSKNSDLLTEKKQMGFRLWGGDKTWIAPQNEWLEGIPPIDLDAGKYSVETASDSIRMVSPRCRETDLQITRIISVHDNNSLKLSQIITNKGEQIVRKGIWNVTQFLRPVKVLVPSSCDSVFPCDNEGDSIALMNRFVLKSDGKCEVTCDKNLHYKYGITMSDPGYVISFMGSDNNRIIHRRSFSIDRDEEYAHNASVEIYNSPDYNYMELEIHGPRKTLSSGESSRHDQIWEFELEGK